MSRIILLLPVALTLAPMIGVSMGSDGGPRLSAAEVVRIADAKARSALRRELTEFRRSPPRYSEKTKTWTVVYRNTAGTAPSDITVEISDVSGEASVSFGDGLK